MENYLEINKASWNRRTVHHLDSEMYAMSEFMAGKTSLKEIEIPLLGDLKGKRVLHLQCHFGQDTLSMARMGAHVTGVDLSNTAIKEAQALTKKLGLDAEFICCDVYDLPNHLDEKFDVVFTTYGTIGWLPDLEKWSHVVSGFLKPEGKFVFAEFHPVVWMFDDDLTHIKFKYSSSDPIVEDLQGTYAKKDISETFGCVTWNHGIADVLQNLIKREIEIVDFQEYDYSPYDCMSHMTDIGGGRYRIRHLGDKLPMVYSVVGKKKS